MSTSQVNLKKHQTLSDHVDGVTGAPLPLLYDHVADVTGAPLPLLSMVMCCRLFDVVAVVAISVIIVSDSLK